MKAQLLHLTDIHGNIRAIQKISNYLKKHTIQPAVVLITGDGAITTPLDMVFYHVLTKRNLRRSDYARGVYGRHRASFTGHQKRSLVELDALFKKQRWDEVYWIPGNTETRECLEFILDEFPHWTYVHGKIVEMDSLPIQLSGFGYSLEHRGSDDIDYTMADGEFYLEQFDQDVFNWIDHVKSRFGSKNGKRISILMFHEFPSFKMVVPGGRQYSGGSKALLDAVEMLRPNLAVFGHFHELPVLSRYQSSILMNPGPSMEYCFGIITIKLEADDVSLQKVQRYRLVPDNFDPILFIYSKRPQLESSSVHWTKW